MLKDITEKDLVKLKLMYGGNLDICRFNKQFAFIKHSNCIVYIASNGCISPKFYSSTEKIDGMIIGINEDFELFMLSQYGIFNTKIFGYGSTVQKHKDFIVITANPNSEYLITTTGKAIKLANFNKYDCVKPMGDGNYSLSHRDNIYKLDIADSDFNIIKTNINMHYYNKYIEPVDKYK